MRRLYELMCKSVFVEIPVSLFHRYKLYKKNGSRYKLILDYCVDAQREMFDRNQYLLLYHMVLNRITGRLPEAGDDEAAARRAPDGRGRRYSQSLIGISQPMKKQKSDTDQPPPHRLPEADADEEPPPSNMTSLVEPPSKTKMPSRVQKPNPSNGQPPSDGRGHRYSPSLVDIREPMKKPKSDSDQPPPDQPMGSS
jgi:hypothetical protein